MNPCRFQPGDKVDCTIWDMTEPPHNRIGSPAKVTSTAADHCQSGWMVTVEGPTGRAVTLDSDWLRKWRK